MQNSIINPVALEYDYDSVKRRIVASKIGSERSEKIKLANDYILRRVGRFRKQKPGASSHSSAVSFVRSDGCWIALACLVVPFVAFWAGNALYSEYAQQRESEFVQRCSQNNFKHLANNICYDEQRHIQTFNSDGTARKSALDWNVWRDTDFADKVANPNKAD